MWFFAGSFEYLIARFIVFTAYVFEKKQVFAFTCEKYQTSLIHAIFILCGKIAFQATAHDKIRCD